MDQRSVAQHATTEDALVLGASPRDALALEHASKALAALKGRQFVRPDEIKRLAPAVLAHRVIVSAQARMRGRVAEQAINDVPASVPVPAEESALDGTGAEGTRQAHPKSQHGQE